MLVCTSQIIKQKLKSISIYHKCVNLKVVKDFGIIYICIFTHWISIGGNLYIYI